MSTGARLVHTTWGYPPFSSWPVPVPWLDSIAVKELAAGMDVPYVTAKAGYHNSSDPWHKLERMAKLPGTTIPSTNAALINWVKFAGLHTSEMVW